MVDIQLPALETELSYYPVHNSLYTGTGTSAWEWIETSNVYFRCSHQNIVRIEWSFSELLGTRRNSNFGFSWVMEYEIMRHQGIGLKSNYEIDLGLVYTLYTQPEGNLKHVFSVSVF